MSWNMPIIDIHTHGIGSFDTKGATPQDILRIAEIHGSHGIDAIIPTIYSASIDQMRLDIAAVKKAMETQREDGRMKREDGSKEVLKTGACGLKPATIAGVYLEGPFLNFAYAGALDEIPFYPRKYLTTKSSLKVSMIL
jgi:N-acetylglucosamine-6-phosphate deacetylase